MRCHGLLLLAAAFGTEAFAPNQPSFARPGALYAEKGEEAAAATLMDEAWPAFEPSGLTMGDVRKTVDNLTKENFQESLDKIESFLVNEAGSSIYGKSMRRLARNAKELGLEIPASFAKEAKCTKSRREKQNAFVKGKEEERLAAEAETAADVEAAAEETAYETVEEPEPVAA